ncbi:hypothetical protein [Nocardia mikamii]|uniref:hypothetical protein n=1 Tax=Nocardia mikamii TaxID=508464 RepID=UPI0012F4F232|nr:hypothetical protein [Nocardia mikamii]
MQVMLAVPRRRISAAPDRALATAAGATYQLTVDYGNELSRLVVETRAERVVVGTAGA